MTRLAVYLFAMTISVAIPLFACEADNLDDFVGYTLAAITAVPGEFEGGDHDKVVKLENGTVFEFTGYNYQYAYHPTVAVFTRHFSSGELKRMKVKESPEGGVTLYKLFIEDE